MKRSWLVVLGAVILVLAVTAGLALAAGPGSRAGGWTQMHDAPGMQEMHAQMPAEMQAECEAMHARMGEGMGGMMGEGMGGMMGPGGMMGEGWTSP